MAIVINLTQSSAKILAELEKMRKLTINRHYYTSDSLWKIWFRDFTIACELDMINAISAADIALIVSSSTSAWLLSPLECSP